MKIFTKMLTVAALASLTLIGCQKDSQQISQVQQTRISQETLNKIHNLGFGTDDVQIVEQGYLVEGDIVLTEELLNSTPDQQLLRIANNEQYRTTNLVTGLPRNITVSIDSKLPSSYGPALDEAIRRYNAENLTITMTKVTSGAAISISKGHGSYLASSGFPTSSGAPYSQVLINSQSLGSGDGSSTFTNYIATILVHEIGHCIGFRHTDYMDRSYSCGGAYSNEGASNVGAILIPGTPSGPDAGSFMLACISSNQNRPFNSNDKTALNYLY
ncbi:MAG: protease [Chitinophagales bacterium]|nr:protease [Chitinophagales bacterium]